MLWADPVMDTAQPRLEIGEDEMDDGQKLLGHFGIPTCGNGVVIITVLAQAGVTAPIVRDDQRRRRSGRGDRTGRGAAPRIGMIACGAIIRRVISLPRTP